MKSWALSVGAVLLLISAINLIIPEGKTSKIIKPVFTVLLLLVIIKPLSNIKNFDYDFIANYETSFSVQEGFIDYVTTQKILNYEKNCQKIILELGVDNSYVKIEYNSTNDGDIFIKKVIINLEKSVINGENQHINIIDEIRVNIAEYLMVEEKVVEIYE